MSLISWLRSQDPKQVAKVYRPTWERKYVFIDVITQSRDASDLITIWHQL